MLFPDDELADLKASITTEQHERLTDRNLLIPELSIEAIMARMKAAGLDAEGES